MHSTAQHSTAQHSTAVSTLKRSAQYLTLLGLLILGANTVAHANPALDCPQFGGKTAECVLPEPPKPISEWRWQDNLGNYFASPEAAYANFKAVQAHVSSLIYGVLRKPKHSDGYNGAKQGDIKLQGRIAGDCGNEFQGASGFIVDHRSYGISYYAANAGATITISDGTTTANYGCFYTQGSRTIKPHTCPTGYSMASLAGLSTKDPFICVKPKPAPKGPPGGCNGKGKGGGSAPNTAHPCNIATGNKYKPELDWAAKVGPLQFRRLYNSLESKDAAATPIGAAWVHNYSARIAKVVDTPIVDDNDNITGYTYELTIIRPDGNKVIASQNYTDDAIAGTNGWFIDRNYGLKVTNLGGGRWQLTQVGSNTHEFYDAQGRLTRINYQNGQYVTLAYPAVNNPSLGQFVSQPSSVTDNFGKQLKFAYTSTGLMSSVTLPTAKAITYTYDAVGRLSTVTRPGYGSKTYVYSENAAIAPSGNPNLLTGIVDEKGIRYESYEYDSADRGIRTSMAGGAEVYALTYNYNYNSVTDPRGLVKYYTTEMVSGVPKIASVIYNTGNGENNTYDAAGNLASISKHGLTTTYQYDLSRNLETSRTEAVGTAHERTISTEWAANLPVPVKVTEPGRETSYTYDASGNALTKTIKDTTTNEQRTWAYTYNSVGLMLTETNPAGEVSTYTYDNRGNVLTITNALGHVTTYANYTALGLPRLVTYPNGHKTVYAYDDAGRLVRQTDTRLNPTLENTKPTTTAIKWAQWVLDLIASWCNALGITPPFSSTGTTTLQLGYSITMAATTTSVTSYVYDAIGQLTRVTFADGGVVSYRYDDAHRLVGAVDQLGNSTTYTLNGAGDITATDIKDSTGVLRLKTQQVFDNLGRLQQDIGNNGQSTTFNYSSSADVDDLAGNSVDALNRNNSSTYDLFKRKATDVDALNQTVSYAYNSLDQLTRVTDARNNSTSYTRNAFDEVVEEVSPDTGTTSRSYSNGRLAGITDSNGVAHSFSYDAGGRMLSRSTTHATLAPSTTTYGYDAGTYGKGLLTSLSNADSEVRYNRDSKGNVVEKTMAYKNNVPLRVQYLYGASGKVNSMLYPSGNKVDYWRSYGNITGVSSRGAALVSAVRYAPTGVAGWAWGSNTSTADQFSLTHDLDGRVANISSTGVLNRSYTYDAGNRIVDITDPLAGIGTQTYVHDLLDRLTTQNLSNLVLAYAYDANSNRTSKVLTPLLPTGAGTPITTDYVLAAGSNRISSNSYLPTGQITADGVRSYTYDAAGRSVTISKGSATISNTYDGLGQRIRKTAAGVSTYYVYDEAGQLLGEYDHNRTMIREYVWLEGRLVGMLSKDRPNITLRVHTDHLGTPRAVSEGNGTTRKVLWRWEGDAFGDVLPNEDVDANGVKFVMPLRMAGQYFDSEVGLHYNYFRDYDPATGRYVESDPIGLSGGLNTYGYVGGKPLLFIDPRGLEFLQCSNGGCNSAQKAKCEKDFVQCSAKASGQSRSSMGPVPCDWAKKSCLKKCGTEHQALGEWI